jgi:ligand-binding sensor domain-containing protein
MRLEVTALARPRRIPSSALVVVLAVVGLLAAGRWLQPQLDRPAPAASSTRPPSTPRPTATAVTLPADSPGITRTARTPLVDAIAVTPGSVWVAAGGLVRRIDPRTRRAVVVPDIETVVAPVVQLAAGAGAVWATTTSGRPLLRIDPRTARVAASLPVPAQAVAADRRGVWAVCCEAGGPGRLIRIDPASGRVEKIIGLPGRPYAVGVGPSAVWVGAAGGLLWRVDPASNRVVATIRLPPGDSTSGADDADALGGGAVAVSDDAVWVSSPAAATVWRIDPRRNRVTEDRVEADGNDLAVAADGLVWATSDTRLLGLGGGPAVRGPRRNLHELETDRITAAAAASDGGLWLGTSQGLFHVSRRVLLAA